MMQMNRHASGCFRNAGFSLTEMMIVLCGAGIIAAMALPGLTTMQNSYNTVFAAQEIGTQLHFAKLKAISSNEALRVNFTNANSYRVELSDGTLIRGPHNLPPGISLNTIDGGTGVTFTGSYVTFQPDGTVPVSGNGCWGRVKLISRDGLRVDILVDRGGLIRQTPSYKTASAPF
jgi:Tfp pilus assembly protein FimT